MCLRYQATIIDKSLFCYKSTALITAEIWQVLALFSIFERRLQKYYLKDKPNISSLSSLAALVWFQLDNVNDSWDMDILGTIFYFWETSPKRRFWKYAHAVNFIIPDKSPFGYKSISLSTVEISSFLA